jgi:hypothetical protein
LYKLSTSGIIAFDLNINPAGLATGLHSLWIRTKNSLGIWGLPNACPFVVQPVSTTQNIVSMEYYWDTDPGEGNGLAFPLPSGVTDSVNLNAVINSNGLSPGLHQLYVRSKKSDGFWGIPSAVNISVKVPDLDRKIIAAEYFWDSDPGEGNGTMLSGNFGIADSVEINSSIPTSMLSFGTHFGDSRRNGRSKSYCLLLLLRQIGHMPVPAIQ